jgi:small subunit ribosomal protein S3
LHTWRADIDYCITEALTVYGKLGIKVWICRGEILSKRDLVSTSALDQGGEATPGAKEGSRQPRREGARRPKKA